MYIKGKIKNYERIRWEATTILYGNMNLYREVMGRNEVWLGIYKTVHHVHKTFK